VTIDAAEVPTPAARRAAPAGVFRDPVTERPLIDFAEFQQEAMADCVCGLARAARQASNGRKIILFFTATISIRRRGIGAIVLRHYAMRRVLASPDIDVLCSPISYQDRGRAGALPP